MGSSVYSAIHAECNPSVARNSVARNSEAR